MPARKGNGQRMSQNQMMLLVAFILGVLVTIFSVNMLSNNPLTRGLVSGGYCGQMLRMHDAMHGPYPQSPLSAISGWLFIILFTAAIILVLYWFFRQVKE